MTKRRVRKALEDWEVALIKGMISRQGMSDQQILAHFTRPTRSVNHRVISEIRTEKRHKEVKACAEGDLDEFLAAWPDIDQQTGLSLRGDELLIKAREAMIAAVQTFNGGGLTFRTELFIVTAIIAWTYLMHAWFRREGIEYRYVSSDGTVRKTPGGAEKYWELSRCIRHEKVPLASGTVSNLNFLIELRDEIEHRSTSRIDETVSAKLQACCINFNDAITTLFGKQFSLERRLPIALQFVTFSPDQRELIKKAPSLPAHIGTVMDAFHKNMTDEQLADPRFSYRVAFVPRVGNRASSSDVAVEFVKPDSAEGKEINRVLLKEVERKRYTAGAVVRMMQRRGYTRFSMFSHTELTRQLNAKHKDSGLAVSGPYKEQWSYYDAWIREVEKHCQQNRRKYGYVRT